MNHNEPFTSETCSCSSKACLLCLKGACLKLKGFGAHGIAVIRAGVSGVKGPRGEDTDHVSGSSFLLGCWLLFSPYVLLWVKLNACHEQVYRQHLYHTLPWPRSGLREYTLLILRMSRLCWDVFWKSRWDPWDSNQFNLISVSFQEISSSLEMRWLMASHQLCDIWSHLLIWLITVFAFRSARTYMCRRSTAMSHWFL